MIHAEESQRLKRRMHQLYSQHCGRSYEEVEAALERDHFMTPEEAQSWGLVDHVYADRGEVEAASRPE
jgi:ATP-dependent Clp protease protease subunit